MLSGLTATRLRLTVVEYGCQLERRDFPLTRFTNKTHNQPTGIPFRVMVAKGCYTCRRRRIICDNGQPTCQKCRDAGKECLGYQKPLVWVKGGVASRGKMMGRSFDDVVKKNFRHAGESGGLSVPVPSHCESTNAPSTVEVSNQSLTNTSNRVAVHNGSHTLAVQAPSGAAQHWGKDDAPISVSPNSSTTDNTHILPGLVDPILKDINGLARFYIFHCMSPCYLLPVLLEEYADMQLL